MSTQAVFEICDVGDSNYLLNDRGGTVAIISKQGVIDWLLCSPARPGRCSPRCRRRRTCAISLG